MFTGRRRVLLVWLFSALVLAACQGQTAIPPSPTPMVLSAAVKELLGKASIKQPGAGDFSPASVGAELKEKGSIQTGEDSRALLHLSTGTRIRIAPASLFTLTSNQHSQGSLATEINLSIGRIFILLNGGRMDVTTPSGLASVRGSYLSVDVEASTLNVTVTCLEGTCSAGNSAGSIRFGGGQKTVLIHCDPGSDNCVAPMVERMTPPDFQDWLNENPETQPILNRVYATLSALPPILPALSVTAMPTFNPALDCLSGTGSPACQTMESTLVSPVIPTTMTTLPLTPIMVVPTVVQIPTVKIPHLPHP